MAYVYLHRKETDNEVFYVGKGSHKNRAYRNDGRNEHWHRVVNKYGKIVEIFKNNIEENLALYLEKFLIVVYGKENLTNKTDGGEGSCGFKWPQSSYDKRSLKEHHMKKEEVRIKVSKAQKGKPKQSIRGTNHWSYKSKEKVLKGSDHPRSKSVVCLTTNTTFISVTEAVKWLKSIGHTKATTGNLSKGCKDSSKVIYGNSWKYAD